MSGPRSVALVAGALSLCLAAATAAQSKAPSFDETAAAPSRQEDAGRAGGAHAAAVKGPLTLSFNGTSFLHRWSQKGQNEFTPAGEENLDTWTSMLTLNVHDGTRSGDQLAQLANQVLGQYQANGRILRTDSKPRSRGQEAEHFAAVLFTAPTAMEAAFARFLLHDQRGLIVVYSHRTYGPKAGDRMAAWLAKNGPLVEKALMAWDGMPPLATLRALPQATGR
jgi:hypothetical protein